MTSIMREDKQGYMTNYGELKEITVGGIKCYMDGFFAKTMGFNPVDVEVGEFLTEISVSINQEECFWDRIIFVKNKEDLKPIALEVSKMSFNDKPLIGSIHAMARIIYRCENGKVVKERSIEEFYDFLTDEEKEYFSI